jgi:thiamine transport system substrate-binding protein
LTVVQDPNLSSPGLAFLLATVAHDPEGWPDSWQALADNDVLVVDGWTTAWTQEFTAGGGGGERPIVVSYASSPPVDVLFADPPRDDTRIGVVDDGCFRQVEYAGVLAGAAHPDAAARVVQALIGAETQAALPESMFVFPAREGVELPEVFDRLALRPSDPIVMSWSEADALRDDVLDRWTDIMLS